MQANTLKADVLLIVVTLLAAISWMFSKEALGELPPLLFIGLRFLIAGVFLAAFSKRSLTGMNTEQWGAAAKIGILFGIAMCLWIFGLFYSTSLGEGAFITSLASILVAPFSYFLFRSSVSRSNWVALPVAMAGLALLSLEQGFHPEASQLFFLAAAVLLSLTFIMNSHAAARMSASALTAISLSLVGIIAISVSAVLETWPDAVTFPMVKWLLLSSLVGTSARFLIQTYAQGLTSADRAAVIMILEPVWTAGFAALWFGETMTVLQMGGCALIFAALLINRWRSVSHLLQKKTLPKT